MQKSKAVLPDSFGASVSALLSSVNMDVVMAFEADAEESVDGVIGFLMVAEAKAQKVLALLSGMKTYATIVRDSLKK